MKAIKIFRKFVGFVLLMISLFLVCAADTPCSTLIFIIGYVSAPVCFVAGMFLMAPKATIQVVREFVQELKEDLK